MMIFSLPENNGGYQWNANKQGQRQTDRQTPGFQAVFQSGLSKLQFQCNLKIALNVDDVIILM